MKTYLLTVYIGILFVFQAITTIASPAYPDLIKMKQPDGSTISVYLRGDEKIHRMESEDGFSLLYDNNRTIVYAIINEEGDMVPSSIAARDISLRSSSDQTFLNGIQKRLNYSSSQINTLRSIWNMTKQTSNTNSSQFRAATGKAYAVCALINFPDKPLVKTKEEFNNLMNQVGYSVSGAKGSVHDYFYENSYEKLDLEITVAGPYTVSKEWAYYGENGANGRDMPSRVQEFAKEAAQLTFENINPDKFDNDNDGFIDAFHIIYAGHGEEAGGDANSIWAHEFGFPAITFGTKKLDIYSCSPELRGPSGSNITNIGVICHEMCHVFGSPDFYDTDGDESNGYFQGTGQWDLMAAGSWNNDGASPAHINMYQKIQFGWVTPVLLSEPQAITGMTNSAFNPVAYRYDTPTQGEYFILENRQKVGFDQYVPGTGLLIYHVSITNADIRNNTVNTRHPQKVYPVCASLNTNPTGTPQSYGGSGSESSSCPINSAGCPFPGASGKTSFTDYSIPSAVTWDKTNTVKPLTEIKELKPSNTVSFRFLMPDAEPVTNLQANVQSLNSVRLTWNKPSDDVIGYNVYRNNLLLIKLIGKDNTSYTQSKVSSGNYNYCVTALYNGKESAPVCNEVRVTLSQIDGNALTVKNLKVQNINGEKDIELTWNSPFVSDWKTHSGDLDAWIYYRDVTQFTSIVRFTTDDIQNFQGSKLTKVRFAINNTQCKYTIQVWTKDPGLASVPGNPVVDQPVNAPSPGIVEISLTDPVTLASNKELWIGIKYELDPMIHVAGVDGEPLVEERNFVYLNNSWYYANFNFFISGYLQFDSNFLNAPANSWLRSTTATATNYIIYRDNVKIATTNQPYYVDPQPEFGHHIYCVSIAFDDGKESESVCVEGISTNNTALDRIDIGEDEFDIYPNPVNKGEDLLIQCDPNTVSTLSLYNINGQLIQQEQITEPVYHKRMDYEPGIYLLQIRSISKTFTRRIIIK